MGTAIIAVANKPAGASNGVFLGRHGGHTVVSRVPINDILAKYTDLISGRDLLSVNGHEVR